MGGVVVLLEVRGVGMACLAEIFTSGPDYFIKPQVDWYGVMEG